MYKHLIYNEIKKRIDEPRRFIQVLSGPRQTGKTTLAQQMMKALDWPGHYATADEPSLKGPDWIEQQWEVVRTRLKSDAETRQGLLILRVLRDGEFAETVLSGMKDLGRKGHSPPRKDRGGLQVRSQLCFWAVGGLPNLTVYRLPIYYF